MKSEIFLVATQSHDLWVCAPVMRESSSLTFPTTHERGAHGTRDKSGCYSHQHYQQSANKAAGRLCRLRRSHSGERAGRRFRNRCPDGSSSRIGSNPEGIKTRSVSPCHRSARTCHPCLGRKTIERIGPLIAASDWPWLVMQNFCSDSSLPTPEAARSASTSRFSAIRCKAIASKSACDRLPWETSEGALAPVARHSTICESLSLVRASNTSSGLRFATSLPGAKMEILYPSANTSTTIVQPSRG